MSGLPVAIGDDEVRILDEDQGPVLRAGRFAGGIAECVVQVAELRFAEERL